MFRGSKIEVKFQGLYQGNGVTPAQWAFVLILMLGCIKGKGVALHLCVQYQEQKVNWRQFSACTIRM